MLRWTERKRRRDRIRNDTIRVDASKKAHERRLYWYGHEESRVGRVVRMGVGSAGGGKEAHRKGKEGMEGLHRRRHEGEMN